MRKSLFFLTLILQNTFTYGVTWSPSTTIFNDGCEFNTLYVDIDSTGDGFAIWNQVNPLVTQIQYTDETSGTWSNPDNTNYYLRNCKASDFSINSDIIGMLLSMDATNTQTILASQLMASNVWSPPVILSDSTQYSSDARVSTSSNGDSVAVWVSSYGMYNAVYGSVFSSGSWSAPSLLSSPNQDAFNPRVGTDANGNAVVTWTRNDGANTHIQAIEYISGSWQTVITISGADSNGLYPDIAVNNSGDALLVWGEYTPNQNLHVCSAKLTAGVWSSPVLVAAPDYISQFPDVVIDASGNGCCIWNENDGTNTRIKAALFSSGSWQTPTFISDSGKTAYKGKLASDDLGNFVCIWIGNNGSNQTLYAATYEGSWSAVEMISSTDKTVLTYDLGINEGGNIIASWLSSDASSSTIKIKTANF